MTMTQTLDGGMYEKVAEYFSILSRTELYTCSASQFSFGKIKEQASTVITTLFYRIKVQFLIFLKPPCSRSIETTIWPVLSTPFPFSISISLTSLSLAIMILSSQWIKRTERLLDWSKVVDNTQIEWLKKLKRSENRLERYSLF